MNQKAAMKGLGAFRNNGVLNQKAKETTMALPCISRLSDHDSADAGSDEDANIDDEEDLGAIATQMNRESIVGAFSGRGLQTKVNPEEVFAS